MTHYFQEIAARAMEFTNLRGFSTTGAPQHSMGLTD